MQVFTFKNLIHYSSSVVTYGAWVLKKPNVLAKTFWNVKTDNASECEDIKNLVLLSVALKLLLYFTTNHNEFFKILVYHTHNDKYCFKIHFGFSSFPTCDASNESIRKLQNRKCTTHAKNYFITHVIYTTFLHGTRFKMLTFLLLRNHHTVRETTINKLCYCCIPHL